MSLPDRPLPKLLDLFYDDPSVCGRFDAVTGHDVPTAYRRMLVHEEHMTVAMEAHHESMVDVDVLEEHKAEDTYARKILLRREKDRAVVQFGLLCVNLALLEDAVRDEILEQRRPLGRILVRHNVMRSVSLIGLWHVTMGAELKTLFSPAEAQATFGRTASIELDGKKAVEVLEIVAPE